jgi:phage virion morphogenesis family
MKKGPPKILVSTGDLRRSVTSREKDKNAIFYALKDRLIFGSKLPYAATHQFGDSRNGRNIPARPYFGVTDKDREEIKRMMRDYFRRHRR